MLSSEHGRMTVYCRGLRRKGNRFRAVLRTLALVELVVSAGSDGAMPTLREASALTSQGSWEQDLDRFALAMVLAETAAESCGEGQPVPELFSALLEGMESARRTGGTGRVSGDGSLPGAAPDIGGVGRGSVPDAGTDAPLARRKTQAEMLLAGHRNRAHPPACHAGGGQGGMLAQATGAGGFRAAVPGGSASCLYTAHGRRAGIALTRRSAAAAGRSSALLRIPGGSQTEECRLLAQACQLSVPQQAEIDATKTRSASREDPKQAVTSRTDSTGLRNHRDKQAGRFLPDS